MIVAKIDLAKVDRARLFEGKNGAKYLDIVLIETPDNQYGNSHMIRQSVSREERAKGIKGNIIGNAKMLGVGNDSRPTRTPTPKPIADNDPDCPF